MTDGTIDVTSIEELHSQTRLLQQQQNAGPKKIYDIKITLNGTDENTDGLNRVVSLEAADLAAIINSIRPQQGWLLQLALDAPIVGDYSLFEEALKASQLSRIRVGSPLLLPSAASDFAALKELALEKIPAVDELILDLGGRQENYPVWQIVSDALRRPTRAKPHLIVTGEYSTSRYCSTWLIGIGSLRFTAESTFNLQAVHIPAIRELIHNPAYRLAHLDIHVEPYSDRTALVEALAEALKHNPTLQSLILRWGKDGLRFREERIDRGNSQHTLYNRQLNYLEGEAKRFCEALASNTTLDDLTILPWLDYSGRDDLGSIGPWDAAKNHKFLVEKSYPGLLSSEGFLKHLAGIFFSLKLKRSANSQDKSNLRVRVLAAHIPNIEDWIQALSISPNCISCLFYYAKLNLSAFEGDVGLHRLTQRS